MLADSKIPLSFARRVQFLKDMTNGIRYLMNSQSSGRIFFELRPPKYDFRLPFCSKANNYAPVWRLTRSGPSKFATTDSKTSKPQIRRWPKARRFLGVPQRSLLVPTRMRSPWYIATESSCGKFSHAKSYVQKKTGGGGVEKRQKKKKKNREGL